MKFIPRKGHVLLKAINPPSETKGGIVLPDGRSVEAAGIRYHVVATGPGVCLTREGQCVLIARFEGNEAILGDENYKVVKEDTILGHFVEESSMGVEA